MVAPSQTLDRGLAVLEAVAVADAPLSVGAISELVGVHRSIAYRLIRTLELRSLIERDDAGDYRPAPGLAVLARSVRLDLRTAAAPELRRLADSLEMTAFVVVRNGHEAITIESAEPTTSNVHVVYRPGTRHPVDRGAPGLALLMATPPAAGERAELVRARTVGWASTSGEVLTAMSAIAAPIGAGKFAGPRTEPGCVGAVAVLWLTGQQVDQQLIGTAVVNAATRIEASLH
jgi:DNA-binding IclR family transcriptional regulator